AGFPVRREGGGSADLAAAGAVLDAGGTVVVFPSGSRTAAAGTCHTGAFRLAAAHGVPVVPIGITGTATLAPPGGSHRRARVEVRIGAPLEVTDVDDATTRARAAIEALAGPAAHATDSRLRMSVARLASRPRAAWVLAAAAFAEAVSWPLLPELTLAALLLAGVVAPRAGSARWFASARARAVVRLVLAAGIGSVLGGLTTAVAARHGLLFPQPLTTPGMSVAVRRADLAHGAAGVWSQPLSGVPFKVFARAAGRDGLDLRAWAGHALLARTARLVAVAAVAVTASRWIDRRPRAYPCVLAVGAALFVVGLATVVTDWR
ncbi:lysophospholipid acyltransferase family protein, partial [Jatrophihabitans sp. YIM 134969]